MLGLRGRQIFALVTVAFLVGAVSLVWELTTETRAAVERARRDADLASRMLVLQINEVVAATTTVEEPLQAVADDERLRAALEAATQHAPAVLYAAFTDLSGNVVAHSNPAQGRTRMEEREPLPELAGFLSPLVYLQKLTGEGKIHEQVTPLLMEDAPFGAVRIGLATTLIRQEVNRVLMRGAFVGLGFVLVSVLAAFFLTRIVLGPLGEVRRGIEALRAGDFGYRIPQQNILEFGKVAEALNNLGAEFGERALTQAGQEPLRQALDLMEDGLVILEPDGEITHINPLAAGYFGWSPGGAMGKRIEEILPKDHVLRRMIADLVAGRSEEISQKTDLPGQRGREGLMAVGHRVHDGSKTLGVLIELKDLSVLRDLQAVMDHSTVLSRLGEMAAGVAHEIRNPLNAITLHLEPLLWADRIHPDELKEAIETTRAQIARLDRVVSGFLKVARLRELTITVLAPRTIVEEVVNLLTPEATMAGLEIDTRFPEKLPDVSVDPEVLRQALTNLVKNAIQAVPSRDGKILVGCRDGESEIRLYVHDSGPGMTDYVKSHAFDLYMTTKEGGTGVGLAYVLQAVEMHGGSVELSSQEGKGTTINLVLPTVKKHRRLPGVGAMPRSAT